MSGVKLSDFEIGYSRPKYDMLLALGVEGKCILGALEYAAELFSAEMMERLVGHYRRLLEEVVGDPEKRLEELELLSVEEREQLIVERNQTEREWRGSETVVDRFVEQARRTPDAIAVLGQDCVLSYAELDRLSDSLANYLRKLGVRTETKVALLPGRNAAMIIAMLAVLKAGGCYIPLDPDDASDRLDYMLQDSQAALVLTLEPLRDLVTSPWLQVVCLDSDAQDWRSQGVSEFAEQDPLSLAYVIYTSGSSGRPKGVSVTHRGLLARCDYLASRYGLVSGDLFLHAVSPSFDAFEAEVFPTLISGATLLMCGNPLQLDEQSFLKLIHRHHPTVLHVPSAYSQRLMEYAHMNSAGLPSSIRLTIIGGEAMPEPRAQRWAKLTGAPVLNEYGPTEATITTTIQEVDGTLDAIERSLPIGRPIPDAPVYVVDQQGCLVSSGLPGELWVGGIGVARGYLGQPARTAERFIPDAISARAGSRLYRTGDLVRWNNDGSLAFLGRTDEQLKVRGHRIEPGEIEAALAGCPGVRQVAVIARDAAPGDTRLYGYVAVAEGHSLSAKELRAHLAGRLPDYMVPSQFILVKEIPLTTNCKVDKAALPDPLDSRGQQAAEQDIPLTQTEEVVASIWCQLLKYPHVGRGENFFEIGGHSLLATQVVSRIREIFGLEVPLRTLFEAPTLEAFSRALERCSEEARSLQVPAIVRREQQTAPLSFAQQRLWFAQQMEPETTAYNIAVALRMKNSFKPVDLLRSLGEISRRHEVLRTVFPVRDGQPMQHVLEPEEMPGALVDFDGLDEQPAREMVQMIVNTFRATPFDLEHGPLMRILLCRIRPDEHVLALCMHHIVGDGWSVGIFIEELKEVFAAFSAGRPSPLAPLPIQYTDFASWQHEAFSNGYFHSQLDYWRKQLCGLEPALVPSDFARPARPVNGGDTLEFSLSEELASGLRKRAKSESVTMFMLLAAALKCLIARYANARDVAIGTSIANRNRAETEPLLGYFINQLVLRTVFPEDPVLSEVLGEVRRTILDAYTYQDLPFDHLVEELRPERNGMASPLFQVLFVFQNTPATTLSLPGLSFDDFTVEDPPSTKFDLTLFLYDGASSIEGAIHYNADIFAGASIQNFIERYQKVLAEFAHNPSLRLSELLMMDPQQMAEAAAGFSASLGSGD